MQATIGGTISSLSGESFQNGAMTATFAHLYNDLGNHLTNDEASYLRGEAQKLRREIGSIDSQSAYENKFPGQQSTDWKTNKLSMDRDLRNIKLNAFTVNIKNVAKAFYSGSMTPIGQAIRGVKSLYQLRSVGQVNGLGIGCNGKNARFIDNDILFNIFSINIFSN